MTSTRPLPSVSPDALIDARAMPLVEALKAIPGTHDFEAYLNEHGVTYVLIGYGNSFRELAQFANKLGKDWGCAFVGIHWTFVRGRHPRDIKRKAHIEVSVVPGQMDEAISLLADILPR